MVIGCMDTGLVGVYVKGVLAGEEFLISRN